MPMRTVEPEPWSLGAVPPRAPWPAPLPRGARVCGRRRGIRELDLGEDAWVSLVIRHGQLVPVQGATRLAAGDEVVVLTDPERSPDLAPVFTIARPGGADADPAVS
jgi:potassium/hydrogen antiporter